MAVRISSGRLLHRVPDTVFVSDNRSGVHYGDIANLYSVLDRTLVVV